MLLIIFTFRQPKELPEFKMGDLKIEVTTNYTYLGMQFKYNGNLVPGIENIKKQATRAMYSVLQKARKLGLDLDNKLQLFDSLVKPICLYGCEVWGFKHGDIVDKLHRQFCKIILKVNKSTPTCMVFGELGRYNLKYDIDMRMLSFWFRTVCCDQFKLSNIFYKLIYNLDKTGVYTNPWLTYIKTLVDKYKLTTHWENQNSMNITQLGAFKLVCKKNIKQIYEEEWRKELNESSKCYLYKNLKNNLKIEKYVCSLTSELRISLTKFRLTNHKLPIEIGRHNKIERNLRTCTKCDSGDLGDEYHYMFVCKEFLDERKKFIPRKLYTDRNIGSVSNFCELMSTSSKTKYIKLAKFAKIIMKRVNSNNIG